MYVVYQHWLKYTVIQTAIRWGNSVSYDITSVSVRVKSVYVSISAISLVQVMIIDADIYEWLYTLVYSNFLFLSRISLYFYNILTIVLCYSNQLRCISLGLDFLYFMFHKAKVEKYRSHRRISWSQTTSRTTVMIVTVIVDCLLHIDVYAVSNTCLSIRFTPRNNSYSV